MSGIYAKDTASQLYADGRLLTDEAANELLLRNADAVLLADVETMQFVYANPAAELMLGYSAAEISELTVNDIHPPEFLPYVRERFAGNMRGDYVLTKELPVCGKDGKITYYDVQGVNVVFEGRHYLMGCFHDISDRREWTREMRASEQRFRNAIDALPMGLLMYSLHDDGRLILNGSNRSSDRILGVECAKRYGLSIEEAFPPLVETEIPGIYKLLASDGGVWQKEQVDYEDDRISGAFEVVAFQIRPMEMAVLFRDITERRKSEDMMRRLMAAMSALGESVVITDDKSKVQYVNPCFEALTGYTLRELQGKPIGSIKSGVQDAEFYEKLWKVLKQGKSWSGDLVNKRKDGTLYHEHVTISPVRDKDGKVVNYVAVRRDLTAERQLERRVIRSQKMAALGQFAHRVAHDTTNSLAAIMGNADLLAKSLKDDTLVELAEEISKAVEDISALTGSLMTFASPGDFELYPQWVHLLISGTREMIDRACRPMVAVEYDVAETLRVNADVGQIEQALMHIVVNACDAMEGKGRLTIRAYEGSMPVPVSEDPLVLAGKDERAAVIDIHNDGPGLTEEECARAFEPFFTTKRDQRRNAGLGLATVYGIVSRHNGDIAIESSDEDGTTVRIFLPLVD